MNKIRGMVSKDESMFPGMSLGVLLMLQGDERTLENCLLHKPLLRALAQLALADWQRREGANRQYGWLMDALNVSAAELVQYAQRNVQSAMRVECHGAADPRNSRTINLRLRALWTIPSALWWLLDRQSCQPTVDIITRKNYLFRGAENAKMRSDVDVRYTLVVFPHRELVSDYARLHRVPYCNQAVLCAVQELARALQLANAANARIIEVGANLGDCVLWAVQRLRAVRSLRQVQATAIEAAPAIANLLERSVHLNQLDGIIKVIRGAAVGPRLPTNSTVLLQAKPRSFNSFTRVTTVQDSFAELAPGEAVEVQAHRLDRLVAYSRADLLLVHINGQELDALQGARRLLARPNGVALIILQLYGFGAGVVRESGYDSQRTVDYLLHHGYAIRPALGRFRNLHTPGAVRRYIAAMGPGLTLNLLAFPRWSRLRIKRARQPHCGVPPGQRL